MTNPPAFTFLSSVRRGLAAAIATPDSGTVAGHVSLQATARTSAGDAQPVDLRLMGPGEIVGLDPRLILSTDPKPNETSFPPNLFVTLELDRPELPWLFTPAKAVNDRLRPWLGLVVVQKSDANTITSDVRRPLPRLHVDNVSELPDPNDAWAWAHVAVSGRLANPDDLDRLLTTSPERVIARLLCPRRLREASSYIAALVPLFESGRAAGLGEEVDAAAPLAPAWGTTGAVDLPVYHHWEFSTGPVGDFRSLALLLRPGTKSASGNRPMDIGSPGGGLSPLPVGAKTPTLGLEGAMRPVGFTPSAWDAAERASFEAELSALIDAGNVAAAGLGPPLYGRWLAAETTVPVGQPAWVRQLNLDPRQRVAAGLGARVVQERHEQLLAQAWAQVGEIERANRALRQAQLARAHLRTIHAGLLPTVGDGTFLSLTSPAHDRVRLENTTARGMVASSSCPAAALGSAFRRIARPRGRFGRRLGRGGGDPGAAVEGLASGALAVAPPLGPPDATPIAAPRTVRLTPTQIGTMPGIAGWQPLAENDPFPTGPADRVPDSPLAAAFRQAAVDWATWLRGFEKAREDEERPALDTAALRRAIYARLDPNETVVARTRSLVSVGAWTGAGDELEPVLAAPRFPQPMWEALRRLSQQYVLPGVDAIEANALLLAEPNGAFIEAFLVGLNHEIGRVLLFAEFPTDQRGTCFRQFWDPRGRVPRPAPGTTDDIGGIDDWRTGDLGSHLATADLDMLVLLVRGELLHRYPNLSIYAAPAVWTGTAGTRDRAPDPDAAHELYPLFRGSLAPDITFLAFSPLDEDEARGGPLQPASGADAGWFFVFQQHPAEPHFGLGAPSGRKQGTPSHPKSIAWDDFADAQGNLPDFAPAAIPRWWQVDWSTGPKWGAEAAATAVLSLRRPVRVAIHASELLP